MDYEPLLRKKRVYSLPEGVMIIYEKRDVASIIDFVQFLNTHRTLYEKSEYELPGVLVDDMYTDSEKLLTHLNKVFPDGDGVMNKEVVAQILDEDREFFEEYMNHLKEVVFTDNKEPDERHPLYHAYVVFRDIESKFFPQLQKMN